MSANSRLGGGTGYRRPSLDVLDALTDPGTSGTAVTSDTSGNQSLAVTSEVSATSGIISTSGNRVTSGTSPNKRSAELRDHVKVARPLVDEMRDAVWFLSEHGRPRVQLGELFDEAVRAWLDAVKAEANGGESFPVRGRLR